MRLRALQDESLKNRKFLRYEFETTDAQCGRGNKAQEAGGRRQEAGSRKQEAGSRKQETGSRHISVPMAVQSKGNALTRNPVKGVLLRLVSRVHTLATSRHLGRQFFTFGGAV